ncbi:putative quinol monooxygenase [Herbaspirillum robiniae]|uniref:Antibiotic biosynthesis monooxygenase n=1 Tax=Herbaspirillum robiniae TaxID=2014887 RepID=A0A246WUQ5_9BURK|nr:antibiotic biosynthesis monooxygenase [Herbaspirillum robiniae]NUT99989.1 antibiotic biosynthesis monooxygenase [Herbaspirillum robiniae]OWY30754.1 antibiotic biosynthesis monooxygenase [Herbaspirillum robiniae]
MSITRINNFRAREHHAADLKNFLAGILPAIRASAGCQSCELLQDHADPSRIVIVETWDSIEAHRESLSHVTPESIRQAKVFLAEAPSGAYYS